MLVGEAPGGEEDHPESGGKPFIGASGRLINTLLNGAGIKRTDVYVTTATKCRPPGNRTPTVEESAACLPYLADEIAEVDPKVIVCIGGSALKTLTGLNAVGVNRGKILSSPKLRTSAKIIVTYHPAATLHNPKEREKIFAAINDDLAMAKQLAGLTESQSTNEDEDRTLIFAGQRQALIDALASIASAKTIVADCEWLASHETDDLIWPWDKRSAFLSIAFSVTLDDGRVHSIGIQWDPAYKKVLQAFMRGRRFVFHNAMADLIWLLYLGFEIELGGDTLILAYLMDEEQRLALDQLAPLMAGVKPGWKKPLWREVPKTEAQVRQLINHNSDDTYATEHLYKALQRRTRGLGKEERSNILRCYFKLLLPAIPTFARIAIAGIGMDVPRLEEAIIERRMHFEEAARSIATIAEVPIRQAKAIAGSPQQTAAYIRASYGLDLLSSRKQELGKYANSYPIIKHINNYRHERKLLGTYLEPWRRLIDKQKDGRIHSVYRLANSRTGRTSAELAEGGSLQLAPREEWLRALVVARQEELGDEWEVLAADYSQIELRVIAWLAPEPTMASLFKQGQDLHLRTAMEVDRRETLRTAGMWFVRAGIPSDRTSAEVLSALFEAEGTGRETDSLLRICRTLWADQESRYRIWGRSARRPEAESQLQERYRSISEIPEEFMRALRKYEVSRSASQGSESDAQRSLEYRDAVQVMSRAGTRTLQQFPQWKELRQRAKGVGFGFCYGMQVDSFLEYAQNNYGVAFSTEEATKARNAYFKLYSGLQPWHDRATNVDFVNQLTLAPTGRYRRSFTSPTEAINTPVQTTASDLTIFAMTLIEEELVRAGLLHLDTFLSARGDAFLTGMVHDSVLLEVRRDVASDVKALVKETMEHPDLDRIGIKEIPVPLVADVKTGANWSSAS